VTSGRLPPPLPAYPLSLPLLGAGCVEITAPSGARQLSIPRTTTLLAAHALRRAGGRGRHDDPPALGASTMLLGLASNGIRDDCIDNDCIDSDCIDSDCIGGDGHARKVCRHPRRGWITIPPPLLARSCGGWIWIPPPSGSQLSRRWSDPVFHGWDAHCRPTRSHCHWVLVGSAAASFWAPR